VPHAGGVRAAAFAVCRGIPEISSRRQGFELCFKLEVLLISEQSDSLAAGARPTAAISQYTASGRPEFFPRCTASRSAERVLRNLPLAHEEVTS